MWHTLALIAGGIGLIGLVVIGFIIARNWQGKLKAAVAHREHLEQFASGGTAGASASAVSTGNVVNIIDKQLVMSDDVGLQLHDGQPRALGGSHLWVPSIVPVRAAARHVVGAAEVDELERSSLRKRLEHLRAAVARGDDTDLVGVDHWDRVVGPDDGQGD